MPSRTKGLASRLRSTLSARPRARAIGAVLEALERRILMTWIGATSGTTDDTSHLYNDPANWAGGVIDNSFSGVTFTANTTLYFNAPVTTGGSGINLGYSGNFSLTFESASTTTETLTLGGGISGTFGGSSVTFGDPSNQLDIDLGSTGQTFTIATGDTLSVLNTITDTGSLTVAGGGTLTLSGANTYSGGTTLSAGQLNINSATAIGTGTFTINGGTIDNTSGSAIILSNNNPQVWNQSFTFNGTDNLNLGTGAVLMGGNITITTNAGELAVGGDIGDGGNGFKLTQSGSNGTLTLSGNNTFSGGTTFTSGGTAGQLNINSATALGTGTFTVNTGSTIDNTSGSAITLTDNNAIHWNGNFTFAGSNDLNLGTGDVTMSSSHTLTVAGAALTFGGVISGSGDKATKNGGGTLVLTGDNTYSGGLTLSAGTIDINNAGALGTGTFTINGGAIDNTSGAFIDIDTANPITLGGSFTFEGSNALDLGTGAVNLSGNRTITVDASTLTVDGAISGGHSLIFSGSGTLTLTGTNTYTGGTTLNAGTLNIDSSSAIGTGKLTIDGGTIDNTSGAAITLSTNNTQAWDGNFTFNGTDALNLGTGNVTLSASQTVTTDGAALTVGGVISGTGFALTASGSGTLSLSGNNTFSGGTDLSGGTLDINNASAIGTGTFTIDGGAIDNTSGSSITLSHNNTQVWNSDFTFDGSNALNLGTGAVTLGATQTVTANGAALTVGGAIGDGGNAYGLTMDGSGTLILNGADTFTGSIIIDSGAVQLGNADAAQHNTVSVDATNGLTFSTAIGSFTLGGFAGTANDTLADTGSSAVTLTVGGNGSTDVYSGALGGSGAIIVAGGVLSLGADNTYSGGTTLNSGAQLNINNASALGTGVFTINGGTIDNTSGAAVTLSTNNVQTWAGSFTFVGSSSLNLGAGAVTMTASPTLTIDAGTLTVGGAIGDSGSNRSLSIHGGVLVLTGANTFGGGVTVATGTLDADNASGSASGTGNVTVDSGATLAGNGTLSGGVTINSGGTLAPGSGGTAILTAGSLTLASGSNLDIVLNGNTAGSGYDQVSVNGAVSISGGNLDLSGTRSAHDGTVITLINNNGGGAITGTFQGLAEGATTTFNGVIYKSSYLGGSGHSATMTALLAGTSTALASSANPSVFGQSVTFTATVTSSESGTPTGTVTFLDGSTTLGTGTLNGSGVATFTTTSLAVASHSITADYDGDTNFASSDSSITTQVVNQDSTTNIVVSSANPSVAGQSVTFTDTVTANAPGSGTPTGTVTFLDGLATLGIGTLTGSGVATFTTSALIVGLNPITADYGGDSNFIASDSTVLSQTVNQDSTTSVVASSNNPSVFGQPVTFTATITANAPGSGTPTGTVTFLDGSTTLGIGTLNGSGQTTFTTSALALGSHSITVVYNGDTNFTTSTSSTLTQVVNQDSTTSAVASSANPSVFGQSVTFTATITANAPGAGTPTGTVTFLDGSTTLGIGTLNGSGQTTFTTSALALGSHSITVVYGGDTNFTTSTSSTLTQVVNQDSTTSAVASSANPSVFGQSVTFTATITANAPGAGTPTGTVTFLDGSTTLGIGTLNGSGQTTFTTSALAVGSHSITVVYSGDSNFVTSTSSTLTQVVNQDSTASAVASSVNPSVFGQSVTFTATITANAPGSGTPTGTVTFLDGSTTLGIGTLDGSGQTTFTTSALAVGSHSISVVYSGDSNFVTSTSSTLTQVVNQDSTTSAVVSSANPSVFGQSVTFTATITATAPGSGTPTGTVTFLDGSTTLGIGTLNGSGQTTFTTSALALGSHSITVVYSGDTNFTTSTSSTLTQVVNQDSTTSAVASSANPSVFGQSVTFTATVTSNAPGSGTPTGTVTFLDGSTTLGIGTLNGSGQTTLTTSALAVGSHSITVVYSGDADFTTSTSSTLTQVVNKDSTTSAFASSANPSVFGQSVTFTATITANAPGAGTPAGTVTFFDGGSPLGAGTLDGSGQATFTTSALGVGDHFINVTYDGDTNFSLSISGTLAQVVNQDSTTSEVVSSANPSAFGESVTFTDTVTANAPGAGIPTGTVTFLDGSTTLGTENLDGSGDATFATSALAIGDHPITVVYNADGNFTTSTTSTLTQEVDQDSTTSAVVSSVNPSVFGESVTFTATVTGNAPGSGTPTGTVTFLDGSTALGTEALDGSGQTTFTTSALAVGDNSITAVYNSDTNFATSTSGTLTQEVDQDSTTSAVASSDNPSVFGQSVTFTATVTSNSPGAGTPTGTVTFLDGSTTLGSGTLDGSGETTFTTSALAVGDHSITVVYNGDTNFTTSTSSALTQEVDQDSTTSAVVSSANPSVFGQSVTFTATVTADAPGAGTPTGTVTFLDGSTTLGTESLDGSGETTFTTSALAVGDHSITVAYNGDTNFATSTSGTLTQVVNQDSATSAVVSSANPSVFGQSVTFTATVTANAPGSGTPTGTVTFLDGSTTLATEALDGSGDADFTTSALAIGDHSITVVYNGDSDFITSTSNTLTQEVDQDSTTAVVASSANPSVFGQSVTFTATVTANAPGSGIPTGTVTFFDGSTTLGTGTLDGSGQTTFTTSALAVGDHSITVVYGGDTNFTTSMSSALTQEVDQDSTTSVVVSSANPSVFGQSITFTATITSVAPGTGTPTGTVTFLDGSTTLGTENLDGSGQTTFTTSALAIGDHSITVVYNGDTNFTTSTSSPLTQEVDQDSTISAVVSSANPSVFGQSVTFTATVTPNAPGAGTPTGTVTFLDGSTTLGTENLDGSGQTTFTTSALAIGDHSITVVYNGDTNFATSTSNAITQEVDQDSTTSAVVSSANPSVFGQSVTFTATITANAPGAGTPTGTVTFLDGLTTLGTESLDGSGQTTLTTSSLAIGDHSITVVYSGDTNFTTSTSGTLTQEVDQDSTTSAVVSSANPSVFGQSVTFTATVTSNAPGSGTPTGTVTFLDGSTTLGSGTLDGSGQTTFTTSALAIGDHSITVVYNGDTNFTTSTSSALTQEVDQDSTTSAVVSSANPSVFGQSVTFTATITADAPGAGTPTGTVTFLDGSTTLGTENLNGSGQATFTTAALAIGDHSITVVYNADTNFTTSTSSALTQEVDQDSTASAVVSSVNPSVFGQSVTFTATITADAPGAGTPTGTVTFLDGLTTLGTESLDGSGQTTFTTSALAVGDHSITVVYNGDTNFTTSTSSALTQEVDQDSTTAAVVSSVNPSVFGQSVTFTATITAVAPGAGTPTGTVTFLDGSTTLGIGTLDGSGQTTFTTSALAVGDHSITVVYNGDTNFTTSTSAALTQTVNQDDTESALISSASTPVFGESVTFTDTVTADAPGSGTPTGTVTFLDGTTTLGIGTLDGSGVATFTSTTLPVGIDSITAVYSGDIDFNASTSADLNQTVNQDATTSALVSSANPSVFGQSVTFTDTVTPTVAGGSEPTGSITFLDGTSTLGTGTLNSSGVAAFTTTSLPVGSGSITAVYAGDTDFGGSTSPALTQVVNPASTTAALADSANPIAFGESVTFTATITTNAPGVGTPAGTVTFLDGTTTLGVGTLNGSGVTTFTTSALAIGAHSITAVYNGSTDFALSTSSVILESVVQANTTSALVASVNPTVFGQSVTFTDTVTAAAPGAGTPTGTVTFLDGSTTLGVASLNGSGVATFAVSTLALGGHSITAVYGGSTEFNASTSSAVAHTVNQSATTTGLTSSANPAALSQSITFTATVTAGAPGAGTPTGSVIFKDGSTTLGSATLNGSGVATFTTSSLAQGNHSITASYNGNADFTGSVSAARSQAVDGNSASKLKVANQPARLTAGQHAGTLVVDVTSNSGVIDAAYNSPASVSIISGPAGGTLSGSLTAMAQSGVATFNNLALTQMGTYVLQVTTNGVTTDTAPITITPGPAAKLAVATTPAPSWQFGPIYPAIKIAVNDQFGNLVTAGSPTVTAHILSGPAGAILLGSPTVTTVNGYATFSNLALDLPGTYTLEFTSGSNSPVAVQTITIVGIPARRYTLNGSSLSNTALLYEQLHNAASTAAVSPPMTLEDSAPSVLTASDQIAAAFSSQPIGEDQLFAANDNPPGTEPLLDSSSETLEKFLEDSQ
jgi:autotransporter-associated beta strand protein